MVSGKISIACLPVAGIENPYQNLMIEGLNHIKYFKAFNGINDRFFGILKTVNTFMPDYIHFDWIQSYYVRRKHWMTLILLPVFMIQVLYVKIFTRTKIVWTLHNIYPHNVSNLKFHKTIRKWFAKQCKWIRVFSEETVVKASEEFGIEIGKFKVIPEGDYISIYPNRILESESRNKLGLRNDSIVILSLGYIKPYKGLENLLLAFSKVKNTNIEMVIAGRSMDKEYTDRLKKTIKDSNSRQIHLIDAFIPVEELQIYYNAADVVVLPFKKVENSGSAIMAMGFKKPIVAPKMGVLKKRLSQQDVLLYDDLENGLNKALQFDKAELRNFGEENYKALHKYTWEDFSKAFI